MSEVTTIEQGDFSLEKALTEVRRILDAMQEEQLDFDKNIALFKEGTEWVQASRDYLDRAELMLQELLDTAPPTPKKEENDPF